MFDFRYEVDVRVPEKVYLFGEDYFTDKRVFRAAHLTMVEALCEKVARQGFPIFVKDLKMGTSMTITSESEFAQWLQDSHYYTYSPS